MQATTAAADEISRILALSERQPRQAAAAIQALASAGTVLTPRDALRLNLARAQVALMQVRLPDALRIANASTAAAQALGDDKLLGEATFLKGNANFMLGDVDASLKDVDRALALAVRAGDIDLQIDEQGFLVRLHSSRGDFEKANFHLGMAEQLLLGNPDHLRQAHVAEASADLALSLGDDAYHLAELTRARTAYLAADNPLAAADVSRHMATALRKAGRWPEALALIEEALAGAKALDDDFGIASAESVRSGVLAALGQVSEGLAASDHALRLINTMAFADSKLNVLLERIDLLTRYRGGAGVPALLEQARAMAGAQTELSTRLRLHEVTAAALEALGRPREAMTELRTYMAVKDRVDRQRLSRQLAAQRGQLEGARLSRDNDLLHREADASRQLLETTRREGRLRLLLAALLGSIGVVALIGLWRTLRQNRRIGRLAGTDALTGAMNRRRIEEVGAKALARCRHGGRPFCLLMLDLDHFKHINDSHGHAVGDRVLRATVTEIKRLLRDVDHLGRYGGEEFVVLLADTPEDTALAVGQRLREAVKALAPELTGVPWPVSFSGGLALAGPDDADFQAVLARADAALYRAKQAGRDCIHRAGPLRMVGDADASAASAAGLSAALSVELPVESPAAALGAAMHRT